MKLSILLLAVGFFGFNSAAPVDDSCVTSEDAKSVLLEVFNEQLGEVFAKDFGVAFDNTVLLTNRNTTGCFNEPDFNFVCQALSLLYETRVPEAVVVISEDCEEVRKILYQ